MRRHWPAPLPSPNVHVLIQGIHQPTYIGEIIESPYLLASQHFQKLLSVLLASFANIQIKPRRNSKENDNVGNQESTASHSSQKKLAPAIKLGLADRVTDVS